MTQMKSLLMIVAILRKRLPTSVKDTFRYIQDCLTWDKFFRRSWAQEGEDLILMRLFGPGKQTGFYVDVGAHHPKRFSNTYTFYRMGWHGINIDAMPGSMSLFDKQRPRDINLEIPIAKEQKQISYFQFNEPALNGFSKELSISRDGVKSYKIVSTQNMQAYPLASILENYVDKYQDIDFMSIDVEGLDLEVLQSNDWSRFRPKVVLVEILKSSLDLLEQDSVYHFLKSQDYHIYAKAFNTAFFVSTEFLESSLRINSFSAPTD
jgi:hypothetical protein